MHNEIFGVSEGHLYGQFLSSDIFCNDFRPIILYNTITKHKNIIIYIYDSAIRDRKQHYNVYIPHRCMKNWELFSAHAGPARMLYLHRKSVFVCIRVLQCIVYMRVPAQNFTQDFSYHLHQ